MAIQSKGSLRGKKAKEKNKVGRPLIVWSDKQYKTFENLCGIQCTIEELESVLDIDHKTIDRLCKEHYKDEDGNPMNFSQTYKRFSASGKASLRRMQFKAADAGNVTMQIWLGKQYLGQTDKQDIEVSEEKDYVFNIIPASENKGD